MEWIRKIKLKGFKKRGLFEVRTDIRFIERHRQHWIKYDEREARKELTKERAKSQDQDTDKINKLSMEIAKHQSTKKELSDLKTLEKDLIAYIDLL